jgi:hypothetical protein
MGAVCLKGGSVSAALRRRSDGAVADVTAIVVAVALNGTIRRVAGANEAVPMERGGPAAPSPGAPDGTDGQNAKLPDEPQPAPDTSGWIPPPPRSGRSRILLLGCAIVAVVLLAGPLIALAILDGSGSGGPATQSVGFGTGGSECTLTDTATSFPAGTPIRAVATFSPDVSSGTITVRMYRDGAELVGMRETVRIEEPTSCIHATLAPLDVGHYRVEYEVDPSPMPPLSGEFDITPA